MWNCSDFPSCLALRPLLRRFLSLLTTVLAIVYRKCNPINSTRGPHLKRDCVKVLKSDNHGYAMVGRCPAYNTDKNLESLCTAESSEADLFGMHT